MRGSLSKWPMVTLLPVLAVICIHFTISGCKHTIETNTSPKTIQLATSASLGKYLTDKNGLTLYYFSNDATGISACTSGCLNVWPIFLADNLTQNDLDPALSIADFKTITHPNGSKQTAYKGWPLYYYAPLVNGAYVQEPAGATTGEGVGNVWYVAKPDYSIMLLNYQLTGANGINYLSDYTPGNGKTSYFTDALGNTIYTFARDSANKNKYTAADFSNNGVWPIYETDKIVVPSTLDKNLFGSITVYNRKQLTYKGWPLYYYGPDSLKRGLNKGVSVPRTLVWPVAAKNIVSAP